MKLHLLQVIYVRPFDGPIAEDHEQLDQLPADEENPENSQQDHHLGDHIIVHGMLNLSLSWILSYSIHLPAIFIIIKYVTVEYIPSHSLG